jgi:outer membrane protein assembly factor BamA
VARQDLERRKDVIPIPEVILDPNEGNTYVLMCVSLLTDEKDEIKYMVAPDFRWNETKCSFPSFRLFAYPTDTRRYTIQLGKSTTRDEDYEIEFSERGLMDNKAFVLAKFLYERDSTERFYGFGNESDENRESNYTGEDLYLDVTPGYWILPQVNVSYRMRIRRFNVQHGQVAGLPYVGVEFPFLYGKGIESSVYWQHRLAIAYDTRDSIDLPTEGTFVNAYVDGADRHVGSSTGFVAFGFEWRNFIPFRGEKEPDPRDAAFVDYLQGGTDTPFWLRNSLGGRRPLRGYGGDRFVDFNRALLSAELRTRVYERKIFGVNGELELAPFIEAGQVFRHIYDPPLDDLHVVGGMGIRALVRPQLVAFVDIGYGSEGDSIFTGIDYPF